MSRRVLLSGVSAICAAGAQPEAIWDVVSGGRSVVGPLRQGSASGVALPPVGEIRDFDPRALVPDRKLHKLLRRGDCLGLYAAARAIAHAGLVTHRTQLDSANAAVFDDRTGVFVGAGDGAFQSQYDFFPALTAAVGELATFGREVSTTVSPMWLLRTLPNFVLCHVGIQYGFKGPNACVTNHSVSGMLAIAEAMATVRAGQADRAVAIGHDAPIEPQTLLYYQRVGLLAADAVRPFDARRTGTVLGEGAGALVLEAAPTAEKRGATILGELLGSGCATEAEGLLGVRADGDGLARAIVLALDDAEIEPADVGMIVAHGNGTRNSDASEAAAIARVFGAAPPPVTAFKWAFGHLIAASGVVETVLALLALRHGVVPGIATLRDPAWDCDNLPVSAGPQAPRSDVALVLTRGFAGMNAALLVRAADRDGRQ